MTSYTADLSFQNGSYTLLSSQPGSANLTSALSGILLRSIDIPARMNSLAQTFLGAMNVVDFIPILERSLAEVTLAWSAGLFETTDTTDIGIMTERPGTQYPLVYLTALVVLYTVYAAMAFYVALIAAFVTSDAVHVRKSDGEKETVTTLDLVVLRLANVFPLVGDFFSIRRKEDRNESHRRTDSVEVVQSTGTDIETMFKEGGSARRIWVGMDRAGEDFGIRLHEK